MIEHMCYTILTNVQERPRNSREDAPQLEGTTDEVQRPVDPVWSNDSEQTSPFRTAVEQLLQALEACAGDPPDCPHCGPARSFAESLLSSDGYSGDEARP